MSDEGEDPDVFTAKLAEQGERFDDMMQAMIKVVEKKGGALSSEERNILAVAFKNVVSQRRASLRVIKSVERKEAEKGSDKVQVVIKYREKVQQELQGLCSTVISLLDGSLIAGADDSAAKVFLLKMKGDYSRYRSEFSEGSDKSNATEQAEKTYAESWVQAKEFLPTTHPVRLGLALNYSVFKYEVQEQHAEALKLAKEAFDGAINDLDDLDTENYKDTTLIMQLLKDNQMLWTEDGAMDALGQA